MGRLVFSLAVVSAVTALGQQMRPPNSGPAPAAREPKVCSIPLLEVPYQNPDRRFNRFSIPVPPHPDHLQVQPPAPPCHMDQNSFRPKGQGPKPLPPLPRRP